MKNKTNICPHLNAVIKEKKEVYSVKGEAIEIQAQVKICQDCHEEIFDVKYDTENLKKAYDIYRERNNLLSTEQIINLRKKYNLSQRAFAALIGCTQATIVRYEKGAIQEKTYNNTMVLLNNPENLRILLDKQRDKLDAKEIKNIETALGKKNTIVVKNEQILASLSFLSEKEADVFSGFKRFNIEKLKAMVEFFADKQKNLYKTKLMKLLWYADMVYFKKYIKSISGICYLHQQFGPVPEAHNLLLGTLEAVGSISTQEQENKYGIGEVIVAGNNISYMEHLTEEELKLLNMVNDRFYSVSAADISNISHEEIGYEETKLKENISFEYALKLKAL